MAAPVTSSTGRRRVPAGHAVAVVLLSLVMAALVNADSMVASINQEPFGSSRAVGLALARPVRTISHWTGLNRPAGWLDQLVHHRRAGARRVAGAASNPSRTANTPAPVTPTTVAVPPRRMATPAQPLSVWMAGDSLMGTVAESFAQLTKNNPAVTVTDSVQIGTGLARPDVYNWPGAVSQELAKANPEVVILMFGANDDQDMQAGGHRVVRGTDAWRAEYARRVNQLMAITATGNRQVIWLGIPAVKRPRLNQTKDTMNTVIRTVAAQYRGVTFVDTGPVFDAPGGTYSAYLSGTAGQPVKVRESDGIHFTLAGANRLSPLLLADVQRIWFAKP
jgi:hypothetical protein